MHIMTEINRHVPDVVYMLSHSRESFQGFNQWLKLDFIIANLTKAVKVGMQDAVKCFSMAVTALYHRRPALMKCALCLNIGLCTCCTKLHYFVKYDLVKQHLQPVDLRFPSALIVWPVHGCSDWQYKRSSVFLSDMLHLEAVTCCC